MKEPDFEALLLEGRHEGFAWFVRRLTEEGADYEPYVLRQVRFSFSVGFLKGVMWQRRRDTTAGKMPA